MDKICDYSDCTSCGVCAALCPQHAIIIKVDQYGVLKPEIKQDKCVNCGLCAAKCPTNSHIDCFAPQKCFAAFDKDEKRVKKSASGGVASILYSVFLNSKSKSAVCGVRLNSRMLPEYVCTEDVNKLDDFKGSIYAQAPVYQIYNNIRERLRRGQNILFIGLPCQVAGLKTFLEAKKVSQQKLFVVDILCHGVVPAEYLKEELQYMMQKNNNEHL